MFGGFFLNQRLIVKHILGEAGTTVVAARPARNKTWLIMDAWAYHDDLENRTCHWRYQDGATAPGKKGVVCGTTDHLPLVRDEVSSMSTVMGWVMATNDIYPEFVVDNLGAANILHIVMLVFEFGPE